MIIIGNAQFQAAVLQGRNRDSLKSLRHSRLSSLKTAAPYLSGAGEGWGGVQNVFD